MTSGTEFRVQNLQGWEELLNQLFSNRIPDRYIWENRDEIISVLSMIGSVNNSNHTFLPQGGGLDLTAVSNSVEDGCIILHFNTLRHLLKPRRVIFESFGTEYEWAYFRLECENLEPSEISSHNGIIERTNARAEEVTELEPGVYIERAAYSSGYYIVNGNEMPLPDHVRPITRLLNGAYAIFAKASIYNNIPSTYDGRHNTVTAEDFRETIQLIVDHLQNTATN